MKTIYIAHPLRGAKPYSEEQCRQNIARVTQICLTISRDFKMLAPISPVHAFSFLDALHCDQNLVIEYCHTLLGACDGMWVFGDWAASSGCLSEIGMYARLEQGEIRFCDFCEETGKISQKAKFQLTKSPFATLNTGHNDLVEYILDEHKIRNAVA